MLSSSTNNINGWLRSMFSTPAEASKPQTYSNEVLEGIFISTEKRRRQLYSSAVAHGKRAWLSVHRVISLSKIFAPIGYRQLSLSFNTSVFNTSGSINRVSALAGVIGRNIASGRWQVKLCDPI